MSELNSTGTATRAWQTGDELLAIAEGGVNPDSLIRLSSLPMAFILGLAAALGSKRDTATPIPVTEITDFAEAVDDRVAALLAAGANITLTYDDVTGVLTIAATGGGSPGGASGSLQFNNGGVLGGAASVEIEGGDLRLTAIAVPATPAAGGLKMFARSVAGRLLPAIVGPTGLDTALQPHLGRNRVTMWFPNGNSTSVTSFGLNLGSATGTATTANTAASPLHARMARIEYLVTAASATAVAGWRGNSLQYSVGGPSAALGGFNSVFRWAPATGLSNASHRAFAGLRGNAAAQTDVDPSSLVNICGMGYDAADANIQFMYNDNTGSATKIDLGASFPKPTADRTSVYEIAMFAPPGTTQSVTYEVRDLVSGAVATGTVTTNLPSTSQLLTPYSYVSVGGVSSVVGIAVFGFYCETDY